MMLESVALWGPKPAPLLAHKWVESQSVSIVVAVLVAAEVCRRRRRWWQ
jgi:hypothetical protein